MRYGLLISSVMCFVFAFPVHARQSEDIQARDAAENAMRLADFNVGDKPVRAQRRTDLEDMILSVDEKTPSDRYYFYDEEPTSLPFDVSPMRMVAVARSTGEIYRLSGFDALPGSYESLEEFNRLTSTLQLSISKERALSLAGLFLTSAVPGGPGEVALDKDTVWLRLAVQDQYLAAYGDVWRALEAYAGWWQQFKSVAPDLSPSVALEADGFYRVTMKRLVLYPGKEPEVQNWKLEVSRIGEVRVSAMQMIFPVHQGWLFYDIAKQ